GYPDVLQNTQDVDIAVELPDGGALLARHLHQKLGSSGPTVYNAFGTASTLLNGLRIELVMTRKESYRAKSRKPMVSPGNLADDALRRDFTVNAMYIDVSGGSLLDPTGMGLADLKAGIIRSVRDPAGVFEEDPLRLLRALRFAAQLGFVIEEGTYLAIKASHAAIADISAERIAEEFGKILSLKDIESAIRGIELVRETGIMAIILPELQALVGLRQNRFHHLDAWYHTLEVLRNTEDIPNLRMAALLHDIGKAITASIGDRGNIHFYHHQSVGARMAREILSRLRIHRSDAADIVFAIEKHMVFKQGGQHGEKLKDATLLRYMEHGESRLDLLLGLIHADNLSHHPEHCMPAQVPALRERIGRLKQQNQKFVLTGRDLMEDFGISGSSIIGEMLDFARERWFDNPTLEKRELLDMLRREYFPPGEG
ncbi:MAG: HDIG domain-containing protein, partial [Candidatus Cloacimonadaceae bacterium]|nr:HDIG domain-containing protein [Candidatus Cloacimonadaceae bacterium]